MTENVTFLIDVDKIIQSKAPNKYKYIPAFLVSYLKKIIHQEEINSFLLSDAKNKIGVDFLKATLAFLDTKVEIKGEENLPKEGLYTFASNHPLGGQDAVALGYVLGTHYNGKVKYLANDLLMSLSNLSPLFIPVNKTGSQGKQFPAMIE
ncbi:MAG: glycerol acyltransferase, partial [Bacteroidaceae bacterium]